MRFPAALAALSLVFACSSFGDGGDTPQGGDAGVAPDGAVLPPGVPPGDDAGGVDAGDDAGDMQPGDLIVLRGDDIVVSGSDVTAWPNALDKTKEALPTNPIARPTRVTVPLPGGVTNTCAAWADGIAPLAMQLGVDEAIDANDYSITIVAKRGATLSSIDNGRVAVSIVQRQPSSMDWKGIALMTEYQDAARTQPSKAFRFAGRATFLAGAAIEVVEPTPSDTTNLHVITAYRRGTDLRIRVDTTVYGPTDVSTAPVPSGQPLLLGNVYTDDPATTFAGTLCHVVVHRGAETDAQIAARMALLKVKYRL